VDPDIINKYTKYPDLIQRSNKTQKEHRELCELFNEN
jgi:hypothetical protein